MGAGVVRCDARARNRIKITSKDCGQSPTLGENYEIHPGHHRRLRAANDNHRLPACRRNMLFRRRRRRSTRRQMPRCKSRVSIPPIMAAVSTPWWRARTGMRRSKLPGIRCAAGLSAGVRIPDTSVPIGDKSITLPCKPAEGSKRTYAEIAGKTAETRPGNGRTLLLFRRQGRLAGRPEHLLSPTVHCIITRERRCRCISTIRRGMIRID